MFIAAPKMFKYEATLNSNYTYTSDLSDLSTVAATALKQKITDAFDNGIADLNATTSIIGFFSGSVVVRYVASPFVLITKFK